LKPPVEAPISSATRPWIEAEGSERGLELKPGAGDVRGGFGTHGKLGVRRHQRARLQRRLARHFDAPPPDQVGGTGAGGRQTATTNNRSSRFFL
jgi:hypothetical protein